MTDTAGATGKPAWLPLGAAALIVPTALAGLTMAWPRPQIEAQLTAQATTALAAAGVPGAQVVFDGRDATISGVAPEARDRAARAVADATGVRAAAFAPGGGAPAAAAPAPFEIVKTDQSIVVTGVAGSEDEHAALLAAAAAQTGGKSVVDKITVSEGTPLPAGITADSVKAAAGALNSAGGNLTLQGTPNGATLTGAVPDAATKAAIGQKVAAALAGVPVVNQLTLSGPADLDATAKQQLQGKITALLAATPITFGPNSPQLTPADAATVGKVLALVKAAPGARLQIDGQVAPGPGNGQYTASQLSTLRANAVRDQLVAGGVPADHVVARGLGEGAGEDAGNGRHVGITVV